MGKYQFWVFYRVSGELFFLKYHGKLLKIFFVLSGNYLQDSSLSSKAFFKDED